MRNTISNFKFQSDIDLADPNSGNQNNADSLKSIMRKSKSLANILKEKAH